MIKILYAEDSQSERENVRLLLERCGYVVDAVADGAEALAYLEHSNYDLVILDAGLPELSGFEVCSRYRRRGGKTLVMMLTGRTDEVSVMIGFESGVDDYLKKPFHFEELEGRIIALTRRLFRDSSEALAFADLVLSDVQRSATIGGRPVKLLPKEYGILSWLLKKGGHSASDELLRNCWQDCDGKARNAMLAAVSRLRKRLREAGSLVEIVYSDDSYSLTARESLSSDGTVERNPPARQLGSQV